MAVRERKEASGSFEREGFFCRTAGPCLWVRFPGPVFEGKVCPPTVGGHLFPSTFGPESGPISWAGKRAARRGCLAASRVHTDGPLALGCLGPLGEWGLPWDAWCSPPCGCTSPVCAHGWLGGRLGWKEARRHQRDVQGLGGLCVWEGRLLVGAFGRQRQCPMVCR